MKNITRQNEWTFGGEVVKLKELAGEFLYSVIVRGISQRANTTTSQICEFKCLIPSSMKDDDKVKKISLYQDVLLNGHIETWNKVKENGEVNSKNMNIVDYVLEV